MDANRKRANCETTLRLLFDRLPGRQIVCYLGPEGAHIHHVI